MTKITPQAVVAGHICLDIIPDLSRVSGQLDEILIPGKLVDVGSAVTATGGTVSNTGLALHRMGVATTLMGKIADDLFGQGIMNLLNGYGPGLAEGMIVSQDDDTSYTVVINPPGVDRIFLHHPGANDTFKADDIDYSVLDQARLFHFGYPPLMKMMYADGGRELESILHRAKQAKVTTSLDMARPDPNSPAGQADWSAILTRSLPHVDIFLPSIDETLFMFDRELFDHLSADGGDVTSRIDGNMLEKLACKLLAMGPAVVALKLGAGGLYVRTTDDAQRIANMGKCTPSDTKTWTGRELLSSCFEVEVAGTTGAGDCTIAGFLAAMLHDMPPEEAITSAVATGACCVESADATSGIKSWPEIRKRIADGWKRKPPQLPLEGWDFRRDAGLAFGPNDQTTH